MKKIIVICEPQHQAGGLESIYQLVDAINTVSDNGYLYFRSNCNGDPVPGAYKKYKVKIVDALPSNTNDVIIVPEVWTDYTKQLAGVHKFVWWLSVDNNRGSYKEFSDSTVNHLYQSEYAKQFLLKSGCSHPIAMHDYIHHDGFDVVTSNKQDIICYNPVKGKEVTDAIIKWCDGIKFVPLQNMTREKIIETLCSAKIYIDFGHHPGRDRIPREAALCDNIVVTSLKGSAKYAEDVSILDFFKLKTATVDIKNYFNDLLSNYNTYIKQFADYKKIILNQKNEMLKEAQAFLEHVDKL
jgi:hypothetical protein